MKIPESEYFSFLPIDSVNAPINIIESLRGRGKTFTAKLTIVRRFIRKNRGAIWCRRTEGDTTVTKRSFISGKKGEKLCKLIGHGLTVDDFKIDGKYLIIKWRGKWQRLVEFVTLSQAGRERSNDDSFFDRMYLDEGVVSTRQRAFYHGNEINDFLDIYISKKRDDSNLRAYILSNKESAYNPYLAYFGIQQTPIGWQGIKVYNHGSIAVQVDLTPIRDKNIFDKKVRDALTGTQYGSFLYGGMPRSFGSVAIKKKPRGARIYCAFDFGELVTAWIHDTGIYFTHGADLSRRVCVDTLTTKYKKCLVFNSKERSRFSLLILAKRKNQVFFENAAVAEISVTLLEKLGI